MLTVNLDAVEPPRGQAGDIAARPAVRQSELCYSPRSGLLLFFLDNKADLPIGRPAGRGVIPISIWRSMPAGD
jgi:hypothetical protein